jgi:hypothetical protein
MIFGNSDQPVNWPQSLENRMMIVQLVGGLTAIVGPRNSLVTLDHLSTTDRSDFL